MKEITTGRSSWFSVNITQITLLFIKFLIELQVQKQKLLPLWKYFQNSKGKKNAVRRSEKQFQNLGKWWDTLVIPRKK